ncbi:MAG: MBL fold metallo-hydrolase [Phycisphaerales bacterium JB058]
MRDVLTELSPEGLAVCWLGHGSVVVGLDDTIVAVDPVLSDRIGPRLGRRTVGLRRLAPPPLGAESLKGLDLLLITHAHFDHLDRPTLRVMADERTMVIVPRRCRRLIPKGFRGVIELGPGESYRHGSTHIRAVQPRHWGARTWLDRRRGSCSYTIDCGETRVLFVGDTAETNEFDEMSGLDLAVFGIGAYDPWEHMHATPEQAWRMFIASGARYLLPVHHSTFPLSDEPVDEPMQRLLSAAGDDRERVIVPTAGEIDIVPC